MAINQVMDIDAIIRPILNAFFAEFTQMPEKFLTEEDARCYLYHLLLAEFGNPVQCQDNSRSIQLHSEVRFYGLDQTLRLRADLVIIDPNGLITSQYGGYDLPSKGYGFDKSWAIIELKLRRKNGKSNKELIQKVDDDRRKLEAIRYRVEGNFYSYIIVFDKKQNLNWPDIINGLQNEFYIYPYPVRAI